MKYTVTFTNRHDEEVDLIWKNYEGGNDDWDEILICAQYISNLTIQEVDDDWKYKYSTAEIENLPKSGLAKVA